MRWSRVLITDSSHNLVLGNNIGTDNSGTKTIPNLVNGVEISVSFFNTIGGTTPGALNLISGNFGDGVLITDSVYNLVLGNFIGTDYSGTQLLGNSGNGVEISSSFFNTIGGTTPGARNVISDNFLAGLLIQGGISYGNLVQGNYIGTNASGTKALGNFQSGISIGNSATKNTVGGITPEARNIISGNFGDGVSIITTTAASLNTSYNLIEGNGWKTHFAELRWLDILLRSVFQFLSIRKFKDELTMPFIRSQPEDRSELRDLVYGWGKVHHPACLWRSRTRTRFGF